MASQVIAHTSPALELPPPPANTSAEVETDQTDDVAPSNTPTTAKPRLGEENSTCSQDGTNASQKPKRDDVRDEAAGNIEATRREDNGDGSRASAKKSAEERFAELESQLEKLKDQMATLAERPKKETDGEGKKEDDKPLSLDIKKLPMEQWQPSRGFDRDEIRGNVLVVYYKAVVRTSSSEAPSGEQTEDSSPTTSEERSHETPQRVQINSRPLLAELEFMTGTSMSKTPCVMIPPFKVLVSCRDKIEHEIKAKREAATRLAAVEPQNKPIGPPTAEASKAEKEKGREHLVADHLECLLKFIDTDLSEVMELRRQIKKRSLKEIAFEHLWHLFEVGDLVFNNTSKTKRDDDEMSYPRAFRVYHVSLGRPVISARLKMKQTMSGSEVKPSETDDKLPEQFTFPFIIDMRYIDYDGESLFPAVTSISTRIRDYQGKRRITDLDFYPAEFAPDYHQRRDGLIARGKVFYDLVGISHKYYQGLTLGKDPEYIEGEVVIDAKTWYEVDPNESLYYLTTKYDPTVVEPQEYFETTGCGNKSCEGCTNNYRDAEFDTQRFEAYAYHSSIQSAIVEEEQEKITDEYFLLLPKDIPGFVLRNRTWKQLDVNCIHNIEDQNGEEKTGFKELVIKKEHKELILALVRSHTTGPRPRQGIATGDDSSSMDLVKGKGKGLVVLLHGAPGVGKTSTAETVAAYTRRPLYPITCGDIGEKAEDVERSLEKHFKLAHKWGCVLLLDEADVFLAKRNEGDVQRNALVSVFLRTLEYYSGILFLTTNRLGAIDEAFHSRITMSFYYESLDEQRSVQIWRNCLAKIDRNNTKAADLTVEYEEMEIIDFARNSFSTSKKKKAKWNGRQIRNAFQTALALARYDRLEKLEKKGISEEVARGKRRYKTVKLQAKHFRRVAQVTSEYHNYVFHMQKNKSLDQAAAEMQNRALNSELEEPSPSARSRAVRQPTPLAKSRPKKEKPFPTVEREQFEELHTAQDQEATDEEDPSDSSSSSEDEDDD